jgi:hypothetical protein
MNRDVERTAAKLEKVCRESYVCDPTEDDIPEGECCVPALETAAEELLEELRRAGMVPAAL